MTEDVLLRELLSAGRRSAQVWKELLRKYSNLFLKIIWQFEKDVDAVMDRYLYIGLGDGGSGGHPQNHGQNLFSLLRKILRIDVDSPSPGMSYSIPPNNRFRGNPQGFREEIWAYGFRNPWRFSQEPVTGEIWAGDVGQDSWEEIGLVVSGRNYGWKIMEGAHCYSPPSGCNTAGLILPIKEYRNTGADCSVTGGYIYRGSAIPELVGRYIYTNGQVTEASLLIDAPFSISSLGSTKTKNCISATIPAEPSTSFQRIH